MDVSMIDDDDVFQPPSAPAVVTVSETLPQAVVTVSETLPQAIGRIKKIAPPPLDLTNVLPDLLPLTEVLPPLTEVLPPLTEVLPPLTEVLPPLTEVLPPLTEVLPPLTEVLPAAVTEVLPAAVTEVLPAAVTDVLPLAVALPAKPEKTSKLNELVSLHLSIDTAVKKIAKDGKLDKHDMPTLVFLLIDLALTPTVKMTDEMIHTKMTEMYNYIMNHYNLYPEDEAEKASLNQLFEMSMRLVLFQPNIKKKCKSCFPWF
jgi:hypothetical protein